jgi:hypothetical protein
MNLEGKKYQLGDKVVPVSKSVGCSLEGSQPWERAKKLCQFYLHVVGYDSNDDTYLCSDTFNGHSGKNYFSEDDLIPYNKQGLGLGLGTDMDKLLTRLSSIQNVYTQAVSEINTALDTLEEKISKINSEKSVD